MSEEILVKLKELHAQKKAWGKVISSVRSLMISTDSEIKELICQLPDFQDIEEPNQLMVGTWECQDSPLGLCIYHDFDDPAWDNCLICNEPHERK